MTYIVLFTDAADADPGIRQRHMKEHLAFLSAHSDRIEAAGPLADPDAQGRDGLWIVDETSPKAVQSLIEADPFWPTGLRAGVAIIPWRRVFRDGAPVAPPKLPPRE